MDPKYCSKLRKAIDELMSIDLNETNISKDGENIKENSRNRRIIECIKTFKYFIEKWGFLKLYKFIMLRQIDNSERYWDYNRNMLEGYELSEKEYWDTKENLYYYLPWKKWFSEEEPYVVILKLIGYLTLFKNNS